MITQRCALRTLTNSVAVISLVFFIAALTVAQSPNAPADKPALEAKVQTESTVANAQPPVIALDEKKTTEVAATSAKSETENAKTKVESATKPATVAPQPAQPCKRKIKADVVALPQPIMLNRLGAAIPNGMIFVLRRDTVNGKGEQLRADKRPRPLVLRANVGDCLTVKFENKIPAGNFGTPPPPPNPTRPTSEVSIHVQGMEWLTGPSDDGSFVGKNDSSLATTSPVPYPAPAGTTWPSSTQTYTLFARAEGTFLLYTMGDTTSTGEQIIKGLFGALNVQPAGAEWYRSQVSKRDLKFATTGTTAGGQPIINYAAVYPGGTLYPDGSLIPANTPVLNMTRQIGPSTFEIVHTDLTAMITGPNAGRFTQPEVNCGASLPSPPPGVDPLFCKNPASPDRRQPYREFTIIYHGSLGSVATQAFPVFNPPPPLPANATQPEKDAHQKAEDMFRMALAGQDAFAINYGTGGIGAEIYANRIGVGPMGNCIDCKFEEFFLSAWAVGDPAMLVDRPANTNTAVGPPPPIPIEPHMPSAAQLCTTAQFGDTTPPSAALPTCANTRNPLPPPPPAEAPPYTLAGLPKATRAYYPDDPSNVYHSYINDHTKFRILHGGKDVTHVHHQHAHQWLQSPNSDESSYLDSQMISPGASYTLEMVYNGSGNRNKVVGDSIFHCHFYPHFAAGMWAMWRTHDVFEGGTLLNKDGIPDQVTGSRALPDGEISAGTPTPAIVPLPTLAMAPMPSAVFIQNGQIVFGTPAAPVQPNNVTVNPGFPFFIPGVAGARPPHPPLDFAVSGGKPMDGGLPRHVVTGGSVAYESHDLRDWSKDLATLNATQLPEEGTNVEQVAMKYFGQRCYATFFPTGAPASCPSSNSVIPQSTLPAPPTGFVLNGLPRKIPGSPNTAFQLGATHGAPFADPAIDDNGNQVGTLRRYQAAAIQADVTLNKQQWHYPQQRMLTLWKDAVPTINFTEKKPGRAPEPLFFRGNSGDIIEYWHTNLVPNYYNVDDFQVRTPTDILGQHIHLVKFDVTSSDGAGNGFNYEDGTFAPGEVQEIIHAINAAGGILDPVTNTKHHLLEPSDPTYKTLHGPPKEIFDCSLAANASSPRCQPCPTNLTAQNRPVCMSWLGAQTTIQRWYIDPLVNDNNEDRTMRTVFTHDHFGPSTHQQAGLYAGLLIEPLKSTWTSNDGTQTFGSRSDGGPTSWQARIITSDPKLSYREFALEFQDLQLAYAWATINTTNPPRVTPDPNPKIGWISPEYAINAPSGSPTAAKPQLVTTIGPAAGTQSVNYTNEPIGFRIQQRPGVAAPANDMSYMYDSSVTVGTNPGAPPNGDPFTPLMRAYQNDNVQIRTLVGAHVFAHQFDLAGPVWFSEPSWRNSGYRSAQAMGLSEHFEMLFNVPSSSAPNINRKCPDGMTVANCVDYLYSPSMDTTGISNGMWGLFRAYDPTNVAKKLAPLPNNPVGAGVNVTYATCPAVLTAPAVKRVFNVTAVTAGKALAGQPNVNNLIFNRGNPLNGTVTFTSGSTSLVGVGTRFNADVQVGDMLVLNASSGTIRGRVATIVSDTQITLAANAAANASGAYQKLFVNPVGVLYVRSEDLDGTGKLKAGVPVEPLILRANAGDCIEVNLTNALDPTSQVFSEGEKNLLEPPFNTAPYPMTMSGTVGLHPQLLSYDSARSNGMNIGWNRKGMPDQLAAFGKTVKYQWYAGTIKRNAGGTLDYTPVEFGSLNLLPSDQIFQTFNGLFGQMIIEPAGSTWQCGEASSLANCDPSASPPPTTRASATVSVGNTKFREFALMISDNIKIVTLQPPNNYTVGAVNYRSEPWKFRYTGNLTTDFSCMTSNQLVNGEPQTPIFTAAVGDRARFRLAHPFGTGTSQVFSLHGHVWQRNPYRNNSREIGDNSLSQWIGSRDNHGSTDHFDITIDKAGGEAGRAGDYLYTAFVPIQGSAGPWGLFRVGNNPGTQSNAACPRVVPPVNQKLVVPPSPKDDVERFIRKPISQKP